MWLGVDLLVHIYASIGPELALMFGSWSIVPRAVFDPEFEQRKFLEKKSGTKQKEGINMSTRAGTTHFWKDKETKFMLSQLRELK